jgi:hypothetical protein
MKIVTMTLILGLPLMALGQTAEQQQPQGQTNDTQATAPAKGKKMRSAHEETTQTDVKGRAQDVNRSETGARSTTTQTNLNQSTKVNVQEFKSRHSDVFSLGRHPKEFFVQRFGASHFRLFGNTYFVFVDGCWVSVDVDGFSYSERVICPGDPEFVVVD